ncbi:hypothetical protein [Burkholderia ubonensis]|uniref:hypothetical protein n=1 Tax=Burkholderia ubonensis TaxID=101571 RepID=UPI000A43F9A8|nr:hypothetical protein [Burkholderia ubonensis]
MTFSGESSRANSTSIGTVDAGNMFAFEPNMADLHKEDVLNSNLLAQLVADKRLSRFDDPRAWYGAYGDVLANLAWRADGLNFKNLRPSSDTFLVKEIVLDEMRRVLSREQERRVEDAIDTLALLPDDEKPVVVFQQFNHVNQENQATSSGIVNIQFSYSDQSRDGGVFCTSIYMFFGIACVVDNPIREQFQTNLLDGSIHIARVSSTLNEDIYNRIRDDVIKKLGEKREEYIAPFGMLA